MCKRYVHDNVSNFGHNNFAEKEIQIKASGLKKTSLKLETFERINAI